MMNEREPTIVWIKREDGTREEWVLAQPPRRRLAGAGQMRRVLVPNEVFTGMNSLMFKEYLREKLNDVYEELVEIHREVNHG